MDTETAPKNIDLRPVTRIIASYVGNHTLTPEQLPALIVSVQQALRDLGKPAPAPHSRQTTRSGARCSGIGSSASNAALRGKRCAGISQHGMGCRSPIICAGGICPVIIR